MSRRSELERVARKDWEDICAALGRPELGTDERFANLNLRAQNAAECVAALDEIFAKRPRAEWLEILRKGGDFIFTVVNSLDELEGILSHIE